MCTKPTYVATYSGDLVATYIATVTTIIEDKLHCVYASIVFFNSRLSKLAKCLENNADTAVSKTTGTFFGPNSAIYVQLAAFIQTPFFVENFL